MKNVLTCLSFILFFGYIALAQDYKTHKVKQGESIESIAKTYKVTPFDIIALNPDAKTNLEPNIVLVIPKSKILETPIETEIKKLLNYVTHKVKRKETLFSISQKYNIEIEDIKKHNKRLYSEGLKKGDRIQIPKFGIVKSTTNLGNTLKKYKVQQSEGKWRVAYKFGISVPELEKLNPKIIDEELQFGQEVIVPNIADNEELEVDEEYGYYTVLPKEGFLALYRKTGLQQDELETLNPILKEGGLKVGMILKVPKSVEALVGGDYKKFSLIDNIINYDTKRLAVMLPFRLHRLDMDSISNIKEQLNRDGGILNISLDFHTGVLVALDSAKQLGISTKLDVYDTRARIGDVTRIINDNNFSNYDAVIGPLIADNFERAASMLQSERVPIISTVKTLKNVYRNVFQTQPEEALLRNVITNYVEKDTLVKNIIIISDSKSKAKSDILKQRFPRAKQIFSRKDKEDKEAYFILPKDIEEEFKPGMNVVFLETENSGYVSSISSMLSSFIDEELGVEVVLMTTDKNRAFEGNEISNNDLSKLKFQYPSAEKPYDPDVENAFVTKYMNTFGTSPNRYAARGFDITMDILLRLASTENSLYDAVDQEMETEYIENKFRYSKTTFGGFYNQATYIVKYEDLKIVEVK